MVQPWFSRAKLGIFLHWGLYSVNGISESWSFYKGEISYDDYMKQAESFTASRYDARQWADLFARSGAKYAVLTAKHHDGMALWDTAQNDNSVVQKTPAARDLVAPFCDALREKGMKVGLYYSHLDWSHPDYSAVPVGQRDPNNMKIDGEWTLSSDSEEWQRFFAFHRGQLEELSTRYGKIDILWFDGSWEPENEYWKWPQLREQLLAWQPEVMLNSRLGDSGDYETPEQGIPIARPKNTWEFCVTVNDSWGFQPHDQNHKPLRQIVRLFAEVIGMGGNMLLSVGPREDGTIIPEHVARMEGLGDWIRRHEEAIYETDAGLPHGHFYGATTLSPDQTVIYAFFFDRPWDNVVLKGIQNQVKRVTVVGSGRELSHRTNGGAPWIGIPALLLIDIPEDALDPNATVIKIELDGALDLYTGSGQIVTVN